MHLGVVAPAVQGLVEVAGEVAVIPGAGRATSGRCAGCGCRSPRRSARRARGSRCASPPAPWCPARSGSRTSARRSPAAGHGDRIGRGQVRDGGPAGARSSAAASNPKVGADFGGAEDVGPSAAVVAAHQVRELTLDLQSGGPVVGDPVRAALSFSRRGQRGLVDADAASARPGPWCTAHTADTPRRPRRSRRSRHRPYRGRWARFARPGGSPARRPDP